MPSPAHQRAPETFKLVQRINQILTSRGITREGFRDVLNERLTPARRLKPNHSGLVQIIRWLDPTSPNWAEPKGEIALAMKQWADEQALN